SENETISCQGVIAKAPCTFRLWKDVRQMSVYGSETPLFRRCTSYFICNSLCAYSKDFSLITTLQIPLIMLQLICVQCRFSLESNICTFQFRRIDIITRCIENPILGI